MREVSDYVKGAVKFSVMGYGGENFINSATDKRLDIWGVVPTEWGFTAYTHPKTYKKLKSVVKKSGVRIKLHEKDGLPFALFGMRGRKGILIGILIFWVILYLLSGRIWRIEVTGNENVSTKTIIHELNELGVKIGATHRDKEAYIIEKNMLINVDGLSFIAVNFRGSSVYVEVNEQSIAPEIVDDDTKPANIVASQDGIIVEIQTYEGQSMVKVGDTVAKGDILISGITSDSKNNALIKKARGKVYARTHETLNVEIAFLQEDFLPSEKETQPFLRMGDFTLPLTFAKEHSAYHTLSTTVKTMKILGVDTFLLYGENTYTYYEPSELMLSEWEAKEYCMKLINELENEYYDDSEIISRSLTGNSDSEHFKVKAEYELIMDIAQSKDIELGEEIEDDVGK